MDITKLAGDLLGMVKAAAPLINLGEEVEAAERLLKSATSAYETIKDALSPGDKQMLDDALEYLAERVNVHAERTKASLG